MKNWRGAMRRAAGMAVTLLALASVAQAGEVAFELAERLNRTWRSQLAHHTVEAPEGAFHKESARLAGPDGLIPVQLAEVETWGTTPFVKRASVAFFVPELLPLATNRYTLSFGPKAVKQTQAADLEVSRRFGRATITTADVGLRLLPTWGGGVQIHHFGTVQNCAILNGKHNHSYGANLMMNGGTVRNCLIRGGEDRHVGGFSLEGGMLENCLVVSNRNIQTITDAGIGGGRVTVASAVMRNCLVRNNWGVGQTGGLRVSAGLVENCTVADNTVSNTVATTVGGLSLSGGTVRNTIVAFNANPNGGAYTNWYRSAGTITYSCTTPSAAAHGTGNIDGLPAFVDAAGGDYRLTSTSPGINAGFKQAWMDGATDLAGAPRLVGRTVDMGAYECQALPGTLLLVR